MSNTPNESLVKKWAPLLESEAFPAIQGADRRASVAQLLENTEAELQAGNEWSPSSTSLIESAPTNSTGTGISNYDPVLINLIRRSAPNLIAYDVVGVQAMNGPTGQIFAIRSRYGSQTGPEAFYGEANTGWSTINGGNTAIVGDAGLNLGTAPSGNSQAYNFAGAMSTAQAEALGSAGNANFREMAISIEKVMVEAKSRALKAEYSTELAQDLKRIHGLDAERELTAVLGTEIISEINREIIRTIYVTAVPGSQTQNVATAGTFDFDSDSNGRWMGEKFAGLHFHIMTEANKIAIATRRGKANLMICSADVASALQMAKVLNVNDAAGLQIDNTGNTFAGVLGGSIRVYIDPYATSDYFILGYKGQNSWDAGMFYCPYVPMQMVRAVGENTFQPKIGFKTRYGMVANPFSRGATASDGRMVANSNVYYSRTLITNIM